MPEKGPTDISQPEVIPVEMDFSLLKNPCSVCPFAAPAELPEGQEHPAVQRRILVGIAQEVRENQLRRADWEGAEDYPVIGTAARRRGIPRREVFDEKVREKIQKCATEKMCRYALRSRGGHYPGSYAS